MAGVWYEYLWQKPFSQDYRYKCSLWVVLSDEEKSGRLNQYLNWNKMAFWEPIDEDGTIADYFKFGMLWDKSVLDAGNEKTGQPARAFYKR